MAGLFILSFMPYFFISAHFVSYVTDRGISSAVAAQAFGMMGIISVAGRLIMSGVAQRLGCMKTIAACFALTSVSIIWLVFSDKVSGIYGFVVVFGFFQGSTLALLGSATGLFFGLSSLSELLGVLLGIGILAGAAAPFLSGLTFDLTGSYFTVMVISALFYAGAALLSLVLKVSATHTA